MHLELGFTIFLAGLSHALANTCSQTDDPGGFVLRPNLYLGFKTRSATPVSTGLLWFGDARLTKIRHEANEEDHLHDWGWKVHDGLSFGEQFLGDSTLGMDLTTHFLQPNGNCSDSGVYTQVSVENRTPEGGSEVAEEDYPVISVLYYVSVENSKGWLSLDGSPEHLVRKGMTGDISITGFDPEFGEFTLLAPEAEHAQHPTRGITHLFRRKNKQTRNSSPELAASHFAAIHVQDTKSLWKVKERVSALLHESRHAAVELIQEENEDSDCDDTGSDPVDIDEDCLELNRIIPILPNTVEENANLIVFQRVYVGPFTTGFGILPNDNESLSSKTKPARMKGISPAMLSRFQTVFPDVRNQIETRREKTIEKFEKVFGMDSSFNISMVSFAHAALANCLGSHGYFYGSSLVPASSDSSGISLGPAGPLFTGVPSRSFFPRGFLWDEGFHQLLVSHWDDSITQDVLRHWLGRMDDRGWVGREQILGAEALSKVPEQFRVQYLDYANPPALLLAVDSLVGRLGSAMQETDSCPEDAGEQNCQSVQEKSRTDLLLFLLEVYPKFKLHYLWTKSSQTSSLKPNTFRWRGRSQDGEHTLTSGIDDYPRGRVNYPSAEAHVDLISWMAWSAAKLSKLARVLATEMTGDENAASALMKDTKLYDYDYKVFVQTIERVHWSEDLGFYCDIGVVDQLYPRKPRSQEENQALTPHAGCVPHIGYVGLMPFLLQLISPEASNRLVPILDAIEDPKKLWSDVGLRSLSYSDYLFGKGEDYWRGKVWINLNYLALRALRFYSRHTDTAPELQNRCEQLAQRLASNLINNLYRQYESHGFLFENYLSETGLGAGTRPFTGWSALVVLIMGDKY